MVNVIYIFLQPHLFLLEVSHAERLFGIIVFLTMTSKMVNADAGMGYGETTRNVTSRTFNLIIHSPIHDGIMETIKYMKWNQKSLSLVYSIGIIQFLKIHYEIVSLFTLPDD